MTQERTLHLYGLVTAETVAPIVSEIIRINNEDEHLEWQAYDKASSLELRKPIHLYIESGGGKIYDCFTALSVMKSSKTPIYTYCNGYVMSSGLTLFLGGDMRFGGSYSQYMYHSPSEDLGYDTLPTLENRVDEIKRVKDIRTKYIVDRCQLTAQDFEDNKYIDVFFDAKRALDLGIIHEII